MNRWAAEFLGTAILVFAGTGAIVVNQVSQGAVTHPGIALTFGLVVMAMIYTWGPVSGAHLNPAVTVASAIAGRFTWNAIPGYLLAQCLGALSATGLLRILFPGERSLGATLPSGSWEQSFVLELALTWILMLVILRVSTGAREERIASAIAIGAVVGLEAMFAGPISGASMNPARSLGPVVWSGNWTHWWIYWVAPMVGAVLAVFTDRWVLAMESVPSRNVERE